MVQEMEKYPKKGYNDDYNPFMTCIRTQTTSYIDMEFYCRRELRTDLKEEGKREVRFNMLFCLT